MNTNEPLVWHTEKRKVKDLQPFEHNPRVLTEKQAKDLEASLARFNLVEIPAINTNNLLVAGHQRIKIMLMRGRGDEEIDVRVPNRPLTDEEYREYLIRSNKNTGEWDFDELANSFDSTKLMEWGFEPGELGMDGMPIPGENDDAVPDTVNVKVLSVPGDLYELKTGNATLRLMCGDCRDMDAVNKLMGGTKADIVWEDPPYNVAYGENLEVDNAQGYKVRTIANDSMTPEQFVQFLRDSMTSVSTVIKDGAMVYIAMSDQEWATLMVVMKECGFHWSSAIIWNKDHLVLSRKDYHSKHEPMWYGWKNGAARLCPLADRQQSDVWDIDRPTSSEEHPHMKPVELIVRCLVNSSKAGDSVIDFFLGSGSTGVACLKIGRNLFSMDIEPRYCDVAMRRWVDYCKEEGIEILSFKRNGEAFDWPSLYEASDGVQSQVQEASKN